MAQRSEFEVIPPGKANDGKFVAKLLIAVYPDPSVLSVKSVTGAATNNSSAVNRRTTTPMTPTKLSFVYGMLKYLFVEIR